MSRAFDKAQEMVLASMEYVKVLGFRLRRTEVRRDDWKLVAQSHADELIKLRQRVDELKAERDAERKAHDEYKERNRELFHRNQRLTAELAVIKDERDALRAERDDLITQLRQSIARGDFAEMRAATLLAELAEQKPSFDPTVAKMESTAEASHITPEGKQTAEGAVEPKPGDVVRLVRVPSEDTVGDTLRKSLEWPWKSLWGSVGDRGEIVESVKAIPGARSVRIMNTGCKVWWPLSCVEVVKGGEQ